jgi:putative flavoprotein involved in K+ transport
MSRCLSERGIDHVVLERGEVAHRWRTHSWDSLRLLTPNWMTRLPGFRYDGTTPDGFMNVGEVVSFLEKYARVSNAPVVTGTTVQEVDAVGRRFRVVTDRGTWSAASVVIATGYCDVPAVPAAHRQLPPSIAQFVAGDYRNPAQLPPGGVLVVGASSSGIQIADELQQSGRRVTLAVGRHTRLPRIYRGRDILWWLDRLGALTQDIASVHNIDVSRQQPSLQLVGRTDNATLDLDVLHRRGVRVVGRFQSVVNGRAIFKDDLLENSAAADCKLAGLRERIDTLITESGVAAGGPEPFVPTWLHFTSAPTEVDLRADDIRSVVWATGYRRAYPWLRIPVVDRRGEVIHRGGITPHQGLYILGLNFMRRRNSSFIDGVGADAEVLADDLVRHLTTARIA